MNFYLHDFDSFLSMSHNPGLSSLVRCLRNTFATVSCKICCCCVFFVVQLTVTGRFCADTDAKFLVSLKTADFYFSLLPRGVFFFVLSLEEHLKYSIVLSKDKTFFLLFSQTFHKKKQLQQHKNLLEIQFSPLTYRSGLN